MGVQNTLLMDLVVVIDALDECEGDSSVGQILDIIMSLSTRNPIRILVSSCPEPEIYRRMVAHSDGNPDSRLTLHEIDIAQVQNDIETHLHQELEEVPLTAAQLLRIVEKSGILFIYASTVARYIKDGLIWSAHEERVDAVLGLSGPFHGNTHQAIDGLYSTILHTALRNPKLNESNRSLLKTLLDIVICVQEPISPMTLAGFLGLKGSQQVEGLLRSLYSVLHIAEKTGLVTTLHASFPDFMLDSQRSQYLCCNLLSVHQMIAQACFTAIKENPVQFNICGLESSYLLDSQVPNILGRVGTNITPKLFYSCWYWETHMELGEINKNYITSCMIFFRRDCCFGWK
ncbi:hypothetical protein B0J17DRAFT_383999 [Rhizoctonia solani]|nr:hypothetical protein B0J17DRAFT_383999 [Rhizoctonia solani]